MRFLIFSLFFCLACHPQKDKIDETEGDFEEKYIYLSHTRLNSNDSVFKKIYNLDLDLYDMLLLGGDLGNKTFEGSLIQHLDSLFDLDSPNTLWSIGNHDKTTDEKFRKHTGKNKYHASSKNNISFIVLDSQDSLSSIIGEQKSFLFNVLDTCKTRDIVILSHKLVFMDKHPVMDKMINQVCNGVKGDCYYCHNPNNFSSEIYPYLLEKKKQGKNIIWVGGDLGVKTSEFEYKDENGIVFLGNGLWFSKKENTILIFSSTQSNLKYRFVAMDTLIKYQNSKFIESLFSNQLRP